MAWTGYVVETTPRANYHSVRFRGLFMGHTPKVACLSGIFSGSHRRAPVDTAEQILMRSTPKDVIWRKKVPFGGGGVKTTKLNVQSPKLAKMTPKSMD